jgi:hypothetical protein
MSFLGGIVGGIGNAVGNAAETAVKISPYIAQQMAAQKALDLQRQQIALNQMLAEEQNRRENEQQDLTRALAGFTPIDSNALFALPPHGAGVSPDSTSGGPSAPPLTSPAPSNLPSETPDVDANGMPTVPPAMSAGGTPMLTGGPTGANEPGPLPQSALRSIASPAPSAPPENATAPNTGGMGGLTESPPSSSPQIPDFSSMGRPTVIGGRMYQYNPMTPQRIAEMLMKQYETTFATDEAIRKSKATFETGKNQAQAYAASPEGASLIEGMKAKARLPYEQALQASGAATQFQNAKALETIRAGVEQQLQKNSQLFESNKISEQQALLANQEVFRLGAEAANRSAEIYQSQRGPHFGFIGGAPVSTTPPSSQMGTPTVPPAPAVPGMPAPKAPAPRAPVSRAPAGSGGLTPEQLQHAATDPQYKAFLAAMGHPLP